MDPALWEIIHSTGVCEEEEVDVIIRLQNPKQKINGVKIVSRLGSIATCKIRKCLLEKVRKKPGVLSLKAPRLVSPDLEIAEPINNKRSITNKTDIRRPRKTKLTGKGVVVGIVDWGCDFNHPRFLNTDGSTRILALWDQRNNSVYYQDDINEAIQSIEPYDRLGYHPADSDRENKGTHGTHVMDIAAGNGKGIGPAGIAPEADLVFVHLANKNTSGTLNLGNAKNIIDAVYWIDKIAGEKPWVANLSVGKHGGPHNGSTLIEMAFDELLSTSKNKFIVQSTGNYYNKDIHRSGKMRVGDIHALNLLVSRADVTPNELEVWMTAGNEFEVRVESASGYRSRWVPLNDQNVIIINNKVTGRIYNRKSDPNNSDNHIDIFFYPEIQPGNWKVYLKAKRISDGIYHAWLERDDSYPGSQTKFIKSDADRNFTLGTIACSRIPLIVGAYNNHSLFKEVTSFSSAGPTRDYRNKPDLVAPGYRILAARSAHFDTEKATDLFIRKSGTSMAAPHVTGTVALCLQGSLNPLKSSEIRNLILSNTIPNNEIGRNANRYGRGYLSIEKTLKALEELNKKFLRETPYAYNNYIQLNNINQNHEMMETSDNGYLDYIEERLPESASTEKELWEAIFTGNQFPNLELSPEKIYGKIMEQQNDEHIHYQNSLYEVIACPECNHWVEIAEGDVLLRSAPGEPGLAHMAVLSESNLLTRDQLDEANIAGESEEQGYYSTVIETRPFRRTRQNRFARRIYDRNGRMMPGQLLLRLKKKRFRRHPDANTIQPDQIREGLLQNSEINGKLNDAKESVIAGIGLGVSVFQLGKTILEKGDYTFSSTPARYVHTKSLPDQSLNKLILEFRLNALHPRYGIGEQYFWYRLTCIYDGYDIKSVKISRLIDRSSGMYLSKFKIHFVPKAASHEDDEVAKIRYSIEGEWDPFGRGHVSFEGELLISAKGEYSININSEKNWVRYSKSNDIVKRTILKRQLKPQYNTHLIYFSPPGSTIVKNTSIRKIKRFLNKQLTTLKLAKVKRGIIPVTIHGYASTTGTVKRNQRLARRRVRKVKLILTDFLGVDANIKTYVHGELDAKTRDNVEDFNERVVRIVI